MINHLTCFLNKCVLACMRDNHIETSSSMKHENVSHFIVVHLNVYITGFFSHVLYSLILPSSHTGHVFGYEAVLQPDGFLLPGKTDGSLKVSDL